MFLPDEEHFGGILSHSWQDFLLACSLHRVQYFFCTYWQRSLRQTHSSQRRDLSHLSLCSLDLMQDLHYFPLTHNLQLVIAWQLEHFCFSQPSLRPELSQRPRSSKTICIPFWTRNGGISGVIPSFKKVISCWIRVSLLLIYHPFRRNFCWPPLPLFISST